MRKKTYIGLLAGSLLFSLMLAAPVRSEAGFRFAISVPLPRIMIVASPSLMVIPGTAVYYAPQVSADLFFFDGYWYRPYQGGWYIAAGYGGPWYHVAPRRVPTALLRMPHHYRRIEPRHDRSTLREALETRGAYYEDSYGNRRLRERSDHGEYEQQRYDRSDRRNSYQRGGRHRWND